MKGLKENIQDKKEKLERPSTRPNFLKPEAFQKNFGIMSLKVLDRNEK